MPDPLPVIQCDVCGTATPARFTTGNKYLGPVTEVEREADLEREGWRLRVMDGQTRRDYCPSCRDLA